MGLYSFGEGAVRSSMSVAFGGTTDETKGFPIIGEDYALVFISDKPLPSPLVKEKIYYSYNVNHDNANVCSLKEFDGKDGKPKYDDQEVLNWQKDNNKTYLTPKEAFNLIKQDELIDWKIKNRLAEKKEVENIEQSGAGTVVHDPKEYKPKNDQELRQAVLEAMNNLEKDI